MRYLALIIVFVFIFPASAQAQDDSGFMLPDNLIGLSFNYYYLEGEEERATMNVQLYFEHKWYSSITSKVNFILTFGGYFLGSYDSSTFSAKMEPGIMAGLGLAFGAAFGIELSYEFGFYPYQRVNTLIPETEPEQYEWVWQPTAQTHSLSLEAQFYTEYLGFVAGLEWRNMGIYQFPTVEIGVCFHLSHT